MDSKFRINPTKIQRLPQSRGNYPDGWMNTSDLEILYSLPTWTNGGFGIEVGTWVGRSSVALLLGTLAAGNSGKMDLIDHGICRADDWQRRFGHDPRFRNDSEKIMAIIDAYAGVPGELVKNLSDWGLWTTVNGLYFGEFRNYESSTKYSYAFLDVTHDLEEIEQNLKKIKPLLSDEFILVLDDVVDEDTAQFAITSIGTTKYWLSKELGMDGKLLVTGQGSSFEHLATVQ